MVTKTEEQSVLKDEMSVSLENSWSLFNMNI